MSRNFIPRVETEPNAVEELRGRIKTISREIDHYKDEAANAKRDAENAEANVERLTKLKEQYLAILGPHESGIVFNHFTKDPEELAKRLERVRRDALRVGDVI